MTPEQQKKQLLKLVYKRDFAKRLNQALDYAGYKKHGRGVQLADQMSLVHQSVRKWLVGETTPTKEKQEQLADLLNVNIAWLSHGQGSMLSSSNGTVPTGVPIIEASQVEQWLKDPEEIAKKSRHLEIPNPNYDLFAIEQAGDSMASTTNKSIPANSVVVIDPREVKPKDNERYLVFFKKLGYSICRTAQKDDAGQIVFTTENPIDSFREIFHPDEDIILGKVKNVIL